MNQLITSILALLMTTMTITAAAPIDPPNAAPDALARPSDELQLPKSQEGSIEAQQAFCYNTCHAISVQHPEKPANESESWQGICRNVCEVMLRQQRDG
ncbi:unnamed protein product [Zymoseptoria tritici ST99CH_3D1]|nr:unnamed protein product [Zymoseptoria tritici ST99CH_3D1]